MGNQRPSLEVWLEEIKGQSSGPEIGIFFIHNGVVRGTARDGSAVAGLNISYDRALLEQAIAQVQAMPGVVGVRAWVNEGTLRVGEDMMCALVAGDVRKNVLAGWQTLVRRIKSEIVTQREILDVAVASAEA